MLNSFDAVVAFQVYEYVLEPIGFLKGIKKLLKAGWRLSLR